MFRILLRAQEMTAANVLLDGTQHEYAMSMPQKKLQGFAQLSHSSNLEQLEQE